MLRTARAGDAPAPIDSRVVQSLLQDVSHGSTEHAVVFRPDQMEFDVAVAGLDAPAWDAPDRAWNTFTFDSMFESSD